MATARQRLALKKIVENRGNISKSMREAGYPETTAKNPKNLTESKGFKSLVEKMDFFLSDEMLLEAIRDDIKMKPQDRIGELNLATKIKGWQKNSLDITSGGEKLKGLVQID